MARPRLTKIDNPAALGERLARLRTERGFSLRQLAFPGCSGAYISAIEKGRRVPSLQVLHELAKRLSVSAEYLATGERAPLEARLVEAEMAIQLGDSEEARALLAALLPRLEGSLHVRATAALGVLAAREGDLDLAVSLLEQARQSDPEAFFALPSAVEELGRSHSTRGDYEQALAIFEAARERALSARDQPRALKAAVLLANTYIDLGDASHSATALAEALRESEELRDPMLRASVLWSQARFHTNEGRHDRAARLAERALATLQANEDDRAIGLAYQMLAYIELEQDHPERALELLELGLPLVERSAQRLELAVFQLDRARALIRLQRADEARELLQQVAPKLLGTALLDGGRSLVALGELYEQLGEPGDASTVYDLAIERLRGARNPYLVRAYKNKSALLEAAGDTAGAFDALKAAIAAEEAVTLRRQS
jgi:tetratricopeptide (TPR) repeat protein